MVQKPKCNFYEQNYCAIKHKGHENIRGMILNSFSFQYHGNARAVFGACLHDEYMNCPEGPIDSIFWQF